MKRKVVNYDVWPRVTQKECFAQRLVEPGFDGYISAVFIEKVVVPLVAYLPETSTMPDGGPLPERLCEPYTLADDGYVWIQRMPLGGHYAQTTMFDAQGRITQWYYDITLQNAVDDQGTPFFDDVYLDVVMLPGGDVVVLDADELDEARDSGDITQAQHEQAWQEARKVMGMVKEQGVAALTEVSMRDLAYFEGLRGKE